MTLKSCSVRSHNYFRQIDSLTFFIFRRVSLLCMFEWLFSPSDLSCSTLTFGSVLNFCIISCSMRRSFPHQNRCPSYCCCLRLESWQRISFSFSPSSSVRLHFYRGVVEIIPSSRKRRASFCRSFPWRSLHRFSSLFFTFLFTASFDFSLSMFIFEDIFELALCSFKVDIVNISA